MDEIRITLETLYDVLRNEKKREDLQKLEKTFFKDVVAYLKEKNALLATKGEEDELFAVGEKRKLVYELRSIKRILKEIYEKREKKIIDIALNRSRTGSDIIDTSSMLPEEKSFYKHVLDKLDVYRRGILLKLFRGELPELQPVPVLPTPGLYSPAPISEPEEGEDEEPEFNDNDDNSNKTAEEPEIPATGPEDTPVTSKVKFLHPMPSFVWKDMKVYGPYEKNQEIEIFPEVADLLVRKGRAEKVI